MIKVLRSTVDARQPGSAGLSTHLLGLLSLEMVVQIGALDARADDGQTLSGLQLIGQGEQTRLLHILLCVHANQHQNLWPEVKHRGKIEVNGER